MRRSLLLMLVLAAVPAAPASAETLVTTVDRPTPVRAWDGTAVFSVHDAQADVFRLAISRDGGPPQTLAVAPRSVRFDADIGPDSSGKAAIVYSRCAVEAVPGRRRRRDCDLYRLSLTTGREAPIRNADSDAASEVDPTIWRGRVAWARTVDGGQAQPVVYTRPLTAPRSTRSRRLPGVPARGSSIGDPELELYGRWVGMVVRYDEIGGGGVCGRWEVRLTTLGGEARQVADHVCGLNGQSFAGVSFADGRLYFARYCAADPQDCGRDAFGAYRHALSTGDDALAGFARRLYGFAWAGGGRAYEVRAPDTPNGYCGNSLPDEPPPPCEVVLTDPLSFAPARAPR